jgi:hypothetical protein
MEPTMCADTAKTPNPVTSPTIRFAPRNPVALPGNLRIQTRHFNPFEYKTAF